MSPNVVLTLALAGCAASEAFAAAGASSDVQQRRLAGTAVSQLLHAWQSLLQQQSQRRLVGVSSRECMNLHCPGAASKFIILQTSLGIELNDTSHMGDAVASMYSKFCDAKADFMCVMQRCSNSSSSDSIGSDPGPWALIEGQIRHSSGPDPMVVAGELECLCDDCPAMRSSMGNLATVIHMTSAMFMGSPGSEEDVDAMIHELCAMVEGIECVIAHSKCQHIQKRFGDLPKSLEHMKPLCSRSAPGPVESNCTEGCPKQHPSTCAELQRMAAGCASGCSEDTLTFLASNLSSDCDLTETTSADAASLVHFGLGAILAPMVMLSQAST